MFTNLLFITVSLALLFLGAESLVRGSASIALRLGLNRLMVGLTIVAFGTSSPELVVSIKSTLANQGDIALGNVVGSNIFNVAVILGIAALVCPVPVHRQVVKIDAPIALGAALLMPLLLLDGRVSRIEGLLLVAGIVAYTWMNVVLARREAQDSDDAEPVATRHWSIDLGLIGGGLAILVLGSSLLVDHSVALAQGLGVSEAVIGLTIVAAGTSMPELATTVVAALRRQPDIALGGVIGSNIFNVLGILGVASVVSPVESVGISAFDLGTMILLSVLLLPLLYTGRVLHRLEGALLLAIYGGYLFILWPK